jgi:hypothetical protein
MNRFGGAKRSPSPQRWQNRCRHGSPTDALIGLNPDVLQYLADIGAVDDECNDAHLPATDRAYQREHLVDAGDEHRPQVMRLVMLLALGQSWLGGPALASSIQVS